MIDQRLAKWRVAKAGPHPCARPLRRGRHLVAMGLRMDPVLRQDVHEIGHARIKARMADSPRRCPGMAGIAA